MLLVSWFGKWLPFIGKWTFPGGQPRFPNAGIGVPQMGNGGTESVGSPGRFVKLTILAHNRPNDGKPGANAMASGTRNIRMLVSQDCFAFLADAMCEYSKKTTRFQSLRATVQHACASTKSMALAPDDLERFLSEHPVDGSVAVWLEVKPDWIADYDVMRQKIALISGKTVQDKVVIPFVIHLAQANRLY